MNDEPQNAHLRLAATGAANWNRWLMSTSIKEYRKRIGQIAGISSGFSSDESYSLAKSIGLANLPNPDLSADFAGATIARDTNFDGFVFLNVDFTGASFEGPAHFHKAGFIASVKFFGTAFQSEAIFSQCQFWSDVEFTDRQFLGPADFSGAAFYQRSQFSDISFDYSANFGGATFSRIADFSRVKFRDIANFERAVFEKGAKFVQARFADTTSFHKSQFQGVTNFAGANFTHHADFREIVCSEDTRFDSYNSRGQFESSVSFQGAKFKVVTFAERRFSGQSNWVDCEFQSSTNFFGCHFLEPPRFQGANFHADTNWHEISFESRYVTPAADAVRHWQLLKLRMIDLNDFENELKFFALELDARGRFGKIRKRIWYWMYGALSEYGQSVGRPALVLLVILITSGAFNVWERSRSLKFFDLDEGYRFAEIAALTISSSLPFAGLSRTAADLVARLFAPSEQPYVYFVSVVQGLLSAALIFLALLAIRNRFRIK